MFTIINKYQTLLKANKIDTNIILIAWYVHTCWSVSHRLISFRSKSVSRAGVIRLIMHPIPRTNLYFPYHVTLNTTQSISNLRQRKLKKKRKQWIVVNVKRLALRSNTFSRKEREEGNGGNFERDENCRENRDAFERLAAWQRFRFVDDGIFNENRWSLVGQKQAGTT